MRLVLASGETIDVSRVGDALEVSALGREKVRVSIRAESAGWSRFILAENSELKTRDFWVDGIPIRRVDAVDFPPDLLSDLLIVANGSVDIDAISVTLTAVEPAAVSSESLSPGKETDASGDIDLSSPAQVEISEDERNSIFANAYALAEQGRSVASAAVISRLARPTDDEARWELAVAQQIGLLAYALSDSGLPQPAQQVALEAQKHLQRARTLPFASGDAHGRSTVDFVSGQLFEQILYQPEEAEKAYRNAALIDPQHAQARFAAEKVKRQRISDRDKEPSERDGGGL